MPATDDKVRVTRPDFELDGLAKAELSAGLLNLQIVETIDGLFRCEAVFGNWGAKGDDTGYLYFDGQTFDFGKTLTVKHGDEVLFEGTISAIEAGFPEGAAPELTILAEDRFQDLRLTRRTRSFGADDRPVSDEDVFRRIASDHQLTPNLSLPSTSHKHLAQLNQSDLAFLRERARALGVELWMSGSELHAGARPTRGGTAITLGRGNELRSFTVRADLAHQRSKVKVTGWDVDGKQAISEEADDGVLGNEVPQGTSGPRALARLAERVETLAHLAPVTGDEARVRAEAHLKLLARRFVLGRGVAETTGALRVGRKVDLTGLGPLFSGVYHLAEVQHLFDGTAGLRTELAAERPWLGDPQ
jgi:phage protein D